MNTDGDEDVMVLDGEERMFGMKNVDFNTPVAKRAEAQKYLYYLK
jgi:hypothetical protein